MMNYFMGIYPLVNIQKAIENRPFIVDLPIKNNDFPWFYVCLPEDISWGCPKTHYPRSLK